MSEGVKGASWLDKAPKSIEFKFDGIEFEDILKSRHNEGCADVVCDHGVLFDDSYILVGKRTKDGYRIDIAFDSSSLVALWQKGSVTLKFNEVSNHWSIKAFVNGKEWKFCDPSAVVGNIILSLICYSDIENGFSLGGAIESLIKDQKHIVEGAALYNKATDCEFYTQWEN